MDKECLWYNGETGMYELLEFEPEGMDNEEVSIKAFEILKEMYGFTEEEREKVLETLYLIDVDNLKKVNKG